MGFALAVISALYLGLEALLVIGAAASWSDGDPAAFLSFIFFALLVPFIVVMHIRQSGSFARRRKRTERISKERESVLQGLLERVAAQADLPAPTLSLADDPRPNAYAIGTTAANSVVTLTAGLVEELTDKEIEAVFGHELTHIANRDGAVMTFASLPALAGSSAWHDADLFHKAVFLLWAPVWAPLYALSLALMWSISRYREYVADRGSALLTGAPEQLMSALTKLEGKAPKGELRVGFAISALCIVSERPRRRLELLMDHPPLEKRLRRLEEIAHELGRPA
jgi:heat shock protein HtpX